MIHCVHITKESTPAGLKPIPMCNIIRQSAQVMNCLIYPRGIHISTKTFSESSILTPHCDTSGSCQHRNYSSLTSCQGWESPWGPPTSPLSLIKAVKQIQIDEMRSYISFIYAIRHFCKTKTYFKDILSLWMEIINVPGVFKSVKRCVWFFFSSSALTRDYSSILHNTACPWTAVPNTALIKDL